MHDVASTLLPTPRRRPGRLVPLVVAAALCCGVPAAAWDRTGHLVVARIAWEQMSPAARERASELLAAAPADADLRQLLPLDSRPDAARRAEHFQLAACWPDLMRDGDFPERRDKYHHSDWHWINHFFETRGPDLEPHERIDLEPVGRIVERLGALTASLGDDRRSDAERAIDLAWTLHLAGDVHQPLHATARVTATEPAGDRGGNLFELDGRNDLHGFWDSILRSSNFRWFFRSEDAYVQRIARSIAAEHPRAELGAQVDSRDFAAWARESFEIAMARVYSPSLTRGRKPPRDYEELAVEIARRRVALAGYRLAAVLEEALGGAP